MKNRYTWGIKIAKGKAPQRLNDREGDWGNESETMYVSEEDAKRFATV